METLENDLIPRDFLPLISKVERHNKHFQEKLTTQSNLTKLAAIYDDHIFSDISKVTCLMI